MSPKVARRMSSKPNDASDWLPYTLEVSAALLLGVGSVLGA